MMLEAIRSGTYDYPDPDFNVTIHNTWIEQNLPEVCEHCQVRTANIDLPDTIAIVETAALAAQNEELARLKAEVRELRKVGAWQPVEEETNLKGYKDGFQITVKPNILMVESFWYWGEIPLPDNIRLCRKVEA